eukprot:256359_1
MEHCSSSDYYFYYKNKKRKKKKKELKKTKKKRSKNHHSNATTNSANNNNKVIIKNCKIKNESIQYTTKPAHTCQTNIEQKEEEEALAHARVKWKMNEITESYWFFEALRFEVDGSLYVRG